MRAKLAVAACAALLVGSTSAAVAAEPVVVSPVGEVVEGFAGPVVMDFTEHGSYAITVRAADGGNLHTEHLEGVTVTEPMRVERMLTDSIDKPGQYEVVIFENSDDSSWVQYRRSGFTIPGGEDPVVRIPRVVRNGFDNFQVDFSRAPIGYYDLTLRSKRTGEVLWQTEMLGNHEDFGVLTQTVDEPLTSPGRYVLDVVGTSMTRGYGGEHAFTVRR